MRKPPCPQDNNRDNVDEHDDGDDNDNHFREVETNAVESDGDDNKRDSPAFAVESIHQFNANVTACHLTTGDRQWYIIGCYLAPFDNTMIRYVEAEMVE